MAEINLDSGRKMPLDVIKKKFQNFINTLIRLVGDETSKASIVKKLIQNLIDGVTEPEEFQAQLQKELQCSQQPYLIYFLKQSLHHVRLALVSGEMSIEGINPPPMQSLVPSTRISPEAIKIKCQNFLDTLIRLVGHETAKTSSNVKKLIQNLIDGIIEPEEFSTQLQKELQINHQPYLAHFLKKSLSHVQQALISGEMTIDGIRPPPESVQSLVPTTQDMTTDIEMGKAIADYLQKCEADLKHFKPSSESEVVKIMHIREFKKDATVRKELRDKLLSLVQENSSNSEEKSKLLHDVLVYIDLEKERKNTRRIVTLNRRRGQLKKIWESRGLREECVEENSLQVASSKDIFDMSSLKESLPSKPGDSDTRKLAERLAKEYLSFVEEKMRSFRRSEIFRILTSNAPEQNNESSSKCQSKSLTRMVKKVCGDVKNARIFSFRPVIKKFPKDEKDKRTLDLDGESSHQNGTLQSEEVTYRMGREMLVLLKSPCANTAEKGTNTREDDIKAANNLQNPELCLFNKDQVNDEQQRIKSVQKQQLHDSISLSRQLSRLKITNSRRGDMAESEIEKTSADQNKNEQEKVALANRRRELVERLREQYRQHKLKHETEAQNKN